MSDSEKSIKKSKRSKTKCKYTESHWLNFVVQGAIALGFGGYIMFADVSDIPLMMVLVGVVLMLLSAVEIINLIHRCLRRSDLGMALAIAIFQIGIAVALFATKGLNVAVPLSIVAGYTIIRGVFEIVTGIRTLSDPADKFMWTITGMLGVILGFVILNSGNLDLANTTFVRIFGTYLMVFGLANVVFSIHSKKSSKR